MLHAVPAMALGTKLNDNTEVYLLAWICQFEFSCIWRWSIGSELSRRLIPWPRQIYVSLPAAPPDWANAGIYVSENISTNPGKTGTARELQPCRRGQGESRVKSTTSEMPDKITHTGPRHLRENCKLPINILHSHTTTIDAGHSLLNSDQKLRKCKISYLMLDQCNKLAFYPHSDEINIH